MLEIISPLVWKHLAYTTAPYAFFDASIKTCNEKEPQSPDGTKTSWYFNTWQFIQVLKPFHCSIFALFSYFFIPVYYLDPNINTFALATYNARYLNGSNNDNIFLNKFRFVYWKYTSIGTLWYMNWSSFAIRSNPSVFADGKYYFDSVFCKIFAEFDSYFLAWMLAFSYNVHSSW